MPKREAAKETPQRETPLGVLASYLTMAAVWLFAVTYGFQNFLIPSSSMASTLLVGDHVLVDHEVFAPAPKWAQLIPYREVRRGDIIVFHKPFEEHEEYMVLVKRVIAIPGDRIHLRRGVVYLNGVPQSERYVAAPSDDDGHNSYVDDFPSVDPATQPGVTAEWSVSLLENLRGDDLVVPAGKYFAMGDNREKSLDSRFWGFVPRENIIGRPLFVYWSIETPAMRGAETSLTEQAQTMVDEFTHFFSHTRWSRTFHRIQ